MRGVEDRLEFFRNFIRFGAAILPLPLHLITGLKNVKLIIWWTLTAIQNDHPAFDTYLGHVSSAWQFTFLFPLRRPAESVRWLQSYSSFHIWKKSEVFPVLQNLTHMRGEEIFHWQINMSLQGESIWMKSLGAYQRCQMRRRIKFRTTSAPEWCLQSIHVFARTLFTSTYLPGLCTFFFLEKRSLLEIRVKRGM